MLIKAEDLAQTNKQFDILSEIYCGWASFYLAQVELSSNSSAQLYASQALQYAEKALVAARNVKLALEEGVSLRVWGQALVVNSQLKAALLAFAESKTCLESLDPYETALTQLDFLNRPFSKKTILAF